MKVEQTSNCDTALRPLFERIDTAFHFQTRFHCGVPAVEHHTDDFRRRLNACRRRAPVQMRSVYRDPATGLRQFLGRPADQATIECWERFSATLEAALEKYPDCAIKLDVDFTAILDRLTRAILGKGPETRQRFLDMQREFERLWRAGRIDGPEMKKLFADWIAWLHLVGISIETDPGLLAFQNSTCLKLLLGEIGQFDCDPKYTALSHLIAKALGHTSAQPAAR